MKHATDPLDALAGYLSQLFDTNISITDIFDVFAGLFVMGLAITFIVRLKRASKPMEDDEQPPKE